MGASDSRAWLVSYDIRRRKRLTKVHKWLLQHGVALQYSVFLGVWNEPELEAAWLGAADADPAERGRREGLCAGVALPSGRARGGGAGARDRAAVEGIEAVAESGGETGLRARKTAASGPIGGEREETGAGARLPYLRNGRVAGGVWANHARSFQECECVMGRETRPLVSNPCRAMRKKYSLPRGTNCVMRFSAVDEATTRVSGMESALPGPLPVLRLRLHFEAAERYEIRGYRGSAWRGVFWSCAEAPGLYYTGAAV